MQLKIKIDLHQEPQAATIAPFDWHKISLFVLLLCGGFVVIGLMLWHAVASPLPESPPQQLSSMLVEPTALPATENSPSVETQQLPQRKSLPSNSTEQVLSQPTPQLTSASVSVNETEATVAPNKLVTDSAEITTEQLKVEHKLNSRVKRAHFASAIINREPEVITSDELSLAQHPKLYLFSQIINSKGKTIRHQWYFNGQLSATVTLAIGSENWRTFSSKKLTLGMLGVWRVDIVDESDNVLSSNKITVVP